MGRVLQLHEPTLDDLARAAYDAAVELGCSEFVIMGRKDNKVSLAFLGDPFTLVGIVNVVEAEVLLNALSELEP